MTTSYDVAKLAGVSQSTVSRAFRSDVSINPETKEKIMKIAQMIGYYPNSSARDLKNGESNVIGLLLPDINNTFYSAVVKEIESNLGRLGYRLMIAFSEADEEREKTCIEMLISSRVAGIIYTPVHNLNTDVLKAADNFGIPIVQFTSTNKYLTGASKYLIDDNYGAYTAARYVFNMNHSRVLLFESLYNSGSSEKAKGFNRAAEESGVKETSSVVFCDTSRDIVSQIIVALTNSRPSAVITSNIMTTIATLRACRRLGFRIPDDINIIAYDDSEWLEFMHIDAIAHPIHDIGREVADLVVGIIKGNMKRDTEIMTMPYLVVRGSVKMVR
ncbi:MAG: LacI family DNA-binding transcriptional regulator [Clostridia bacterium]|nr:LacI family DNA-binding transcriptional regulator [Clostridia bacterium]